MAERALRQSDSVLEAQRRPPMRFGRKRDGSRDVALLAAALEILAEVGYAGMTMDSVADRAGAGKATVYRRWPSKQELVLDAVASMAHREVGPLQLPDTGTFRGDIVALIKPTALEDGERRLKVMAGILSMLASHPALARVANAVSIEPWIAANRVLMRRAVERGEFSASVDIETLARVIPSMASFRISIQGESLDRAFFLKLIDGVVLPALRGAGASDGTGKKRRAKIRT